jgi:hypothetical protein
MNLSAVNGTVVGAGDRDDGLDLYNMHHGGAGHSSTSSSQENLTQDGKLGGIKVTTILSQESVSRDENSSVGNFERL